MLTLPTHPPAQVVVCSGQVLKTCCALPIPSATTASSASAQSAATAGSTAYGGRRLSGSSAAIAALPAGECTAGDSVCEQAAALLQAEQKPTVPELVCKVRAGVSGGWEMWNGRHLCAQGGQHVGQLSGPATVASRLTLPLPPSPSPLPSIP